MYTISREIAYKTFARLFYYPDIELADLVFNHIISAFINATEPENQLSTQLSEWIDSFDKKEDLLEALQVEYTALFITNFPTVPAPIYKSVYDENELFGNSTTAIVEIYEENNFRVSDNMTEPADHLAIELEFIYRLIEAEKPMKIQISFINEQILSWIEQFSDKVKSYATLPFYPVITKLIINYLRKDATS